MKAVEVHLFSLMLLKCVSLVYLQGTVVVFSSTVRM